jgi:methylenetetrahydrofolate reductase (NADPH)
LVREASVRDCFSIGVAGFPEVHPRAQSRADDLTFLKEKIEAGAAAVITQLFFDNEDYYRFVEDLRSMGVTVPIIPGVLPILSAPQVRRFTALCCAKIPAKLERELVRVEDDENAAIEMGIEYATQQCEDLIRFGVPGLHFYSLNKSYSLISIVKNLGL